MYTSFLKRLFDFFLAFIGLLVALPILIVVTILLTIVNNGKPFFFQTRPGLNGKTFRIIKFKTMNDKKDNQGKLLSDSKRLTRTGSFVRKTSLDEVPQLLNVLKGDMSLIGPRPLLVKYLDLYTENQSKRHLVRPGITGWAQVNGRNAIDWETKFLLDVFYVENLNFKLDVVILIKTVAKVFKSEGISSGSSKTMEAFKGNKIT